MLEPLRMSSKILMMRGLLTPDDDADQDAKDDEAKFEQQYLLRLTGMFVEQMLVIGDQTTRRLLWAHILRLFGQVNLIDTKLAIQPSPGHFHAQMKLGACFSAHLDHKASKPDVGTFRNLQDAVGRSNSIGKKWPAAYDANRRFLGDFLHVHSVGFALQHFGMQSTTSNPTKNAPPKNWTTIGKAAQAQWFQTQMRDLSRQLFSWKHRWSEAPRVRSHQEAADAKNKEDKQRHFCPRGCGHSFKLLYGNDMLLHLSKLKCPLPHKPLPKWSLEHKYPDAVFNYARRAWNEAMLFEVYEDMIRFNNGPKMCEILSKWMSPITFISSNKSHYTYEGLFVHAMTHFLLSPRMAHKFIWNGTCCGHDRPGDNQPCDHRIENVNRTGKESLAAIGHQNLGRVDLHALGQSFLPLHDACLRYDRMSRVPRASAYCSTRSRRTPRNIIIKHLV